MCLSLSPKATLTYLRFLRAAVVAAGNFFLYSFNIRHIDFFNKVVDLTVCYVTFLYEQPLV
jgi:hypothetical protein